MIVGVGIIVVLGLFAVVGVGEGIDVAMDGLGVGEGFGVVVVAQPMSSNTVTVKTISNASKILFLAIVTSLGLISIIRPSSSLLYLIGFIPF